MPKIKTVLQCWSWISAVYMNNKGVYFSGDGKGDYKTIGPPFTAVAALTAKRR